MPPAPVSYAYAAAVAYVVTFGPRNGSLRPGNGSLMVTNVVLVLGVVIIRFSMY